MRAYGYIALALVVAGCNGVAMPGRLSSAELEVQMLTVSGTVDGHALDGMVVSHASGERTGDIGTFFVDGPELTMQLSACPLGQSAGESSPYGGGGGPGFDFPDLGPDAPDGSFTPPVQQLPSADCAGRSLFVCAGATCTGFPGDAVDVQFVDESGWRHLTTQAAGPDGSVQIDLRYRER